MEQDIALRDKTSPLTSFFLLKPQYCQMKVSPMASFHFNYFPQNLQIPQLDYVSILYMLHDRKSISTRILVDSIDNICKVAFIF